MSEGTQPDFCSHEIRQSRSGAQAFLTWRQTAVLLRGQARGLELRMWRIEGPRSPIRLGPGDSALTTAVTCGAVSGQVERARIRARAARPTCSRRERPAALPQDLVVGE
jgi:hypothetical protein